MNDNKVTREEFISDTTLMECLKDVVGEHTYKKIIKLEPYAMWWELITHMKRMGNYEQKTIEALRYKVECLGAANKELQEKNTRLLELSKKLDSRMKGAKRYMARLGRELRGNDE